MRGEPDGLSAPTCPPDEGVEPARAAGRVEIEGARLLGNEARGRLRADGFGDDEIDAWANAYYVSGAGGADEGDVDGLIAWIAEEQAAGRQPGTAFAEGRSDATRAVDVGGRGGGAGRDGDREPGLDGAGCWRPSGWLTPPRGSTGAPLRRGLVGSGDEVELR